MRIISSARKSEMPILPLPSTMTESYFCSISVQHGFGALGDDFGKDRVLKARGFGTICDFPERDNVPDTRHLGAWDDGPGPDGVLKVRSLDQDEAECGSVLEKDETMNMHLLGARDDGPGRVGNWDSWILKYDARKNEIMRLVVIVLGLLEFVGDFGGYTWIFRGTRPKRCPPRRASGRGLFVLVFAVLLAVSKGQFYEAPGYSTVESMTSDLKKLTKENKQIRDTNLDLQKQITEMAEKLADIRATESAEEARRQYENLPFYVKWFTFWYEPLTDEKEEKKEEQKGCTTIKCCLLHIMERLMDWAWLFASDPICLFEKITKKLSSAFESQIKFLSAILGAALVFIGMNVTVYAVTKFAELCEQIRKLIKFLLKLPLIAFLLESAKKFTKWVLTTSEVVRTQEVADKVEKKVDVLTEALQKIVDIVEKPDGSGPSGSKAKLTGATKRCSYCGVEGHTRADCPRMKWESQKCNFCGRRGHTEENCFYKKGGSRFQKKPLEGKGPKASSIVEKEAREDKVQPISVVCDFCGGSHKKESCLKNKAVKEKTGLDVIQEKDENGGSSSENGKKSAQITTIEDGRESPEKEYLVYAPIQFEGIKFSRCLIDTGAQVNIMPAREVTKHGFTCHRDGIRAVRGFDGSPGRILGTIEGNLSIGRNDAIYEEFLISPDVTRPIVGLPTMARMGLTINCASHEIVNNVTGDILLCSVVTAEKN